MISLLYDNGSGGRYEGYFSTGNTTGLKVGDKKKTITDGNGRSGCYAITDFVNLHSNRFLPGNNSPLFQLLEQFLRQGISL